jgi:prepilin-type N-terminal cleavage/methylation domain-containing protein
MRTLHIHRSAHRAFTLLELLVVMGILLVLATLTGISVTKVTRDAKLASATNTLVAALGNARAIAIRDNTYVMVTFRLAGDLRAVGVPIDPPVVQVVTARWTGEVITDKSPRPTGARSLPDDLIADRFLPVPGVPQQSLPAGILVAGPAFGYVTDRDLGTHDSEWRTQPRFAGTISTSTSGSSVVRTFTPDLATTEVGWGIAVLFGPDGRTLSRNPEQVNEVNPGADSTASVNNAYAKAFVDFNGNGYPACGNTIFYPTGPANANPNFYIYDEPLDEPLVDYVPYLAVFSEKEARERFPDTAAGWRGPQSGPSQKRVDGHTLFINEQADRITFNRFTGVAGLVSK